LKGTNLQLSNAQEADPHLSIISHASFFHEEDMVQLMQVLLVG